MKYPIPPGVFDIIPQDDKEPWKSSYLWSFLEQTIRQLCLEFGFEEIRTPMFERTELFQRGVGEASDIVSKEMYTFLDKGGRSLSLRPEGTAPAMRAFIDQQLHVKKPIHKLFYIAPMFRYERAQAGRYRQHHQFGAEVIGVSSPEQDAELIAMLYTFYKRLGLKNLSLFINSIGDSETRLIFKKALKEYLEPHLNSLSLDSKTRFEVNPLRILDSKDLKDREILEGAPSILDFLNGESKEHYEKLKEYLTILDIPYKENAQLVRGLDYYNRTVFEVVAGELGAQNSIGGGGRYDDLLRDLGGPDLPAIGFGTGLERVLQTLLKQQCLLPKPGHPLLFLIPLGENAKRKCFHLLHRLRQEHIPAQMDFSGKKVGKSLQYADSIGSDFATVIGDEELESGKIELKHLATGKTTKIEIEALIKILTSSMQEKSCLTT